MSIFNIAPQLTALESGHSASDQESATKAIFQFKGHQTEGYAMDWCRCDKGKLATGDCNGSIYVYHPSEASWTVDRTPFLNHQSSVEDIQWSPSEATVFASCSVDRTIKIWDTRSREHKAMLSVNAHASDVNVISWNREVGYLMVSGSDDGTFRIWDFRNNLYEWILEFMYRSCSVGDFNYLNAPITSVEWSPHDSSVLAVSSDEQLTIWDLSLEADAANEIQDVPPQLLFVHAVWTENGIRNRVKLLLRNFISILRYLIWWCRQHKMDSIALSLILQLEKWKRNSHLKCLYKQVAQTRPECFTKTGEGYRECSETGLWPQKHLAKRLETVNAPMLNEEVY